jgi:hypothetical protein
MHNKAKSKEKGLDDVEPQTVSAIFSATIGDDHFWALGLSKQSVKTRRRGF